MAPVLVMSPEPKVDLAWVLGDILHCPTPVPGCWEIVRWGAIPRELVNSKAVDRVNLCVCKPKAPDIAKIASLSPPRLLRSLGGKF